MPFLILLIIGLIFGAVLASALRENSKVPLPAVIGGILLLVLILSTVRIVPAGYVGIVDTFGHVSDKALPSGIQFVNPLARVIPMSVRTQELMEDMPVPSKEGLTIKLDISILFKLDPVKAVEMYKTVGPYYQDIVVVPQFRAAGRGITVGHDAKALYTSEREMLAMAIFDSLKSMVEDRGIILERVLLRGMQLPPTVSGAIEQKLKAEQEAERMKFILQRETQEAERKRVEAAGIRDAQTIINQSLTSQYLHYLWINTLNQNPNVIYVATEANMPMFRAINPDDELLRKKPITAVKEQK
ncbi:MAG TPA: prohibitin family protein [Candidatus Omnitrophota bacterium]|nr:prohibitin family protein [Candidatus Omnitrophota bacterium]HPT07413.1 prohibitin family protein [Candidatus Omnitrophota bacterium]